MLSNMSNEITIYIGADNATGKINQDYLNKIETFFFGVCDGFTLLRSVGYWHGHKEESVVIKIITDSDFFFKSLLKELEVLRSDLNQSAILATEQTIIKAIVGVD